MDADGNPPVKLPYSGRPQAAVRNGNCQVEERVKVVPVGELQEFIGVELGPSDWFEMTQEKVNRFADLTEDHQYIHVDPGKAAQTPFGGTIAHGFFTLSLLAVLQGQCMIMPAGTVMAVNYGLNKVRFLNPVRTGKRVRARSRPLSFQEKKPGQILAANEVTVEVEGEKRPALIAEALTLFHLGKA